jgi:hypothetical protein
MTDMYDDYNTRLELIKNKTSFDHTFDVLDNKKKIRNISLHYFLSNNK